MRIKIKLIISASVLSFFISNSYAGLRPLFCPTVSTIIQSVYQRDPYITVNGLGKFLVRRPSDKTASRFIGAVITNCKLACLYDNNTSIAQTETDNFIKVQPANPNPLIWPRTGMSQVCLNEDQMECAVELGCK